MFLSSLKLDNISLTKICGYDSLHITFCMVVCLLPFLLFKYAISLVILYVVKKVLYLLSDTYVTEYIDVKGRGVFITGCDTGLGHGLAIRLDALGFVVFAGCLNENSSGAKQLKKISSSRLHIVEIDVTKDESVARAFVYVENNKPDKGLWAIVNNAGINLMGDVEVCTPSLYQKCLNVNLYGYIRVAKMFIPLLRQSKGRIVNITSVHSYLSLPHWSPYELAKHGLKTMSDSLRLEMKKFGIKVAMVEPGMFGRQTQIHNEANVKQHQLNLDEMWANSTAEIKKVYSKEVMSTWISPPLKHQPNTNTNVVSNDVEHALCSVRPNTRYLVNGYGGYIERIDEYWVFAKVYQILPTWMVDRLIRVWIGDGQYEF